MSDFWKFVTAVFWHWQSWVGGSGAGGVIVVFVAIYERLSGHAMGKRMYVSVFIVVFLIGAFFVAWRDQYHSKLEAEAKAQNLERQLSEALDKSKPKFTGEISVIMAGPAGKGDDAVVILLAIIKNSGAPSIADDWKGFVRLTDGREVQLRDIIPPNKNITLAGVGQPEVSISAEQYLPRKAIIQPIPTGGACQGYFWGLANGVKRDEVAQIGSSVKLSFADVTGKRTDLVKLNTGEKLDLISPLDIQPKR